MNTPGLEGEIFQIEFRESYFQTLGINLIVGEDIELGEPERNEGGYEYPIKLISEKALNYFRLCRGIKSRKMVKRLKKI